MMIVCSPLCLSVYKLGEMMISFELKWIESRQSVYSNLFSPGRSVSYINDQQSLKKELMKD